MEMSLVPPFANELVSHILSFADLDSLIKLTQVSRGVRTLIYSTSTTFLLWLHGYRDARETIQGDGLDLGHQLFQHGKRAMGCTSNRSLRLEYSQAWGFHLFLDGLFFQSAEHANGFAFYWTPSPPGVRSLQAKAANVDIGPEVHNPTLEAVSPDYIVIVWEDILVPSTKLRVVYLGNEERVGDCVTGFDYCDYSFDFLQAAVVTLSIHGNWLGILAQSEIDHSQKIYILNLHPLADGEPVLLASSSTLNTHITGFSFINKRFLLVGTSGALLIFKYSVPGRRQPVLRLRIEERMTGVWMHKSPAILFPNLSSRNFTPAKTGRELLVIRFVTPVPPVRNRPRKYRGRVLVTVTQIFDFLTEKYPLGTTLSPSEWKRFILPLEYFPVPCLRENMDFFVSGTRMVLPVGQVGDGRVQHMEYNFDQRWAMFVDWMRRCGDEAAKEWTVMKRGPFVISSRPFYAPKGTRAMITDDHVVFSPCCTPEIVVHSFPA